MHQLIKNKLVNSKANNILIIIPAFIWAGIIAFISLVPGENIPRGLGFISDKFVHFSMYFSFNFVLLFTYHYSRSYQFFRISHLKAYLLLSLLTIFYGVLMEFSQELMDIGRSFDLKDIYANVFGTLIAFLISIAFSKLRIYSKIIK
jgi:hypothetical protein